MDNIDNKCLLYVGAVENNSLINVLKIDTDITDAKIHNEPNILYHSSYYKFDDLMCLFNNNKTYFSILSINTQSINAEID